MSKPFKREPGSRTIPKWSTGLGGEAFSDIIYQTAEGIAKITINRPEVRNAFRPQTLFESLNACAGHMLLLADIQEFAYTRSPQHPPA